MYVDLGEEHGGRGLLTIAALHFLLIISRVIVWYYQKKLFGEWVIIDKP